MHLEKDIKSREKQRTELELVSYCTQYVSVTAPLPRSNLSSALWNFNHRVCLVWS